MAKTLAIPLGEIRAGDVSIAGGKGANLGELIAAGFAVPDGYVLTTDAYRAAARAAKVDPSAPSEAGDRLRGVRVPRAIATAATALPALMLMAWLQRRGHFAPLDAERNGA